MTNRLINEIGNRYGSLTVIEYTKDKNGRGAWLCKCDCGNTKIVRGPDLRKGKITSCGKGCPTKKKSPEAEVGNRYERLLVIAQNKYRTTDGKILWKCQCDCGNVTSVTTQDLHSGSVKSCGCYSRDIASKRMRIDIAGQKFGKLMVLECTEKQTNSGLYLWKCQCDCGNIVYIPTSYLTSGNTQSCGCTHSHAETYISNYFNTIHIKYLKEYSFEDLQSDKNKKLRFDFGILSEDNKLLGLIEYQGQQHSKPVEHWGGETAFQRLQIHDKMKVDYCEQHNIPLLIINYDENIKDKIDTFLKEINYEYQVTF